jgi:3-hydroxyisobutyrate dehydrogenase-like beta-hydroxyacid dehydrogenase
MECAPLRLGFLGFGEAGYHFAKGLARAGLGGIVAYSRSGARARAGDPLLARAAEAGVELLATPAELCRRADLIVSVVPGKNALPALRSLFRHLTPCHLYVDASTASVEAMEKAAAIVEGKASFVDAAIMGPVPIEGTGVLVLASGPGAARFQSLLGPYGMNIQLVGERAGAASAMKLVRSIFMKGLAALLIETLETAQRRGIREAVERDLARWMDDQPFDRVIRRFVCATAVHAGRRVHEMADALRLMRALGASTRMTRATRAVIREIARSGLAERFAGREPDTAAPVIEAIVARRGRGCA